MINFIKRTLIVSSAAAFLFAVAWSGQAQAAATAKNGCVVSNVFYDEGPRLSMTCTDGSVFYTFLNGAGGACVSRSIDSVKIWESMFMSAFLGGKHVNLVYEPANGSCGVNAIYSVAVVP